MSEKLKKRATKARFREREQKHATTESLGEKNPPPLLRKPFEAVLNRSRQQKAREEKTHCVEEECWRNSSSATR
ncbi:hypothetical protein F2Q69_00050678 [Brassica cretica]|uniref:Uncharacterized protein n=1 Tax=Brassica cretica TaxID=69181 RepID=A0A8S9PTK5_BRACR|nr:hypothetical protein F2Q69_00050678 [Brassica cretica]